MNTRRATLKTIAAGAACLASPGLLRAQESGAITILVGAASSMDITARIIAEHYKEALGRTTVVMPKLGAGQRLALGEVRRAAPDGRTLLFATSGPFSVYPHIFTKLDYDPTADFTPIAGVSYFDVAIATHTPTSGATDLRQLIDWAKNQGSKAVFGSAPGNGSLSHFVGISIGMAAKFQWTHVPYKDSGVGIVDLAAGRLPVMITGLQPLIEMHKAGRIRILAISGDKRSPLVPEVPTLREAGVPISSTTSTGLFGPAKMPPEMVNRLHDALQPMFAKAAIRERLTQLAMTVWPQTPAQLSAHLAEELKRFEVLVNASGYQREPA
ncbi:MAG: Bug family tripartite tricarboxylate transporter substrate binding protein [Hylemonella sp.]